MSIWHETEKELPQEGQECLLLSSGIEGSVPIAMGPMIWSAGEWSAYGNTVQQVAIRLWISWDEIKP